MSVLSLDVGTTGCKGVVFSQEGEILSSAYREYPLLHPRPGWVELDPELLYQRIKEVIQEVSFQVKKDPLEGISFSSQGEAFVPVDREGNFLSHIPVAFDTRGEEFIPRWEELLGEEKIMEITGMPLSSIYSLNKFLWFKEKEPKVFSRTWKFLHCEDMVIYKLGLPPAIDWSLASRTMAFNVRKKNWSEEMLSCAQIDPSLLPPAFPPGKVVGEIPKKVASELNLPPGVKVVTGGHDQPCGVLGAGVMKEGMAMAATGTVECIAPVFKKPRFDEAMRSNGFCCYPHVVPGMYITLAFNFSGGSVLRWFRDTFGEKEKEEAKKKGEDVYDLILGKIPGSPSRILVLPHFSATGTPWFDPYSTGVVLGLSLNTTKGEFIRGILEGVSMEMKLNLELLEKTGIKIKELRAIGGGAKSSLWLQIKSNIYGKRMVSLKVSEAACLGAALLTFWALGKFKSLEEAVNTLVIPAKIFLPQAKEKKIYEEKFLIYRKLYPALKSINHQITRLRGRIKKSSP